MRMSLQTKLLAGISTLVITSGLIIAALATYRYSSALNESATSQGEYLCQSIVMEATDKILINDLMALQKLIHHQQSVNPAVAYIFVQREGEILAHTFTGGFPAALIHANKLKNHNEWDYRRIRSDTDEGYIDFVWPILDGKAGSLRLGLSEHYYQTRVRALWAEMAAGALVVLSIVFLAGAVIARRISKPIRALALSADQIDAGNLDITIQTTGDDEIDRLGHAFSRMITRIRDYTGRLEETTAELGRAYRQTRSSFELLQKVGTLTRLEDVGRCLFQRFQEDMSCSHFMMTLFTSDQRHLMVFTNDTLSRHSPETAVPVLNLLQGNDDIIFIRPQALPARIQIEPFASAERIAVFPFSHEMVSLGALMVACQGNCHCNTNDLEVIDLILHEAAGALKRAVRYEEEKRQGPGPEAIPESFEGMVGKAPEITTIFRIIEDIAPTDASVLIQGESGTGKELVAQAIHQVSPRRDKPFVVINCSAYPATLLESELFGHEKGAFTGAVRRKVGRFEQADGGTVFLDEIGDIVPSAQIKLLRVLQTRQFERLGGETTLTVDVRIISATNRDLLQDVKNGSFREDLYYRLKVIPMALPTLRQRRNDIPLLARHFLQRFARVQGKSTEDFSSEAMRLLMNYPWPGNVRELENAVEHTVVLAKTKHVQATDLPAAIIDMQQPGTTSPGSMQENEARLLQETLEACEWNKRKAARKLGISRNTLYRKLRKYRIQAPTMH